MQSSEWSILAATAILRNCAQYDQNREFYESSDVVKTIEWFTDKSSSQKRVILFIMSSTLYLPNPCYLSEFFSSKKTLDYIKNNKKPNTHYLI